MESNLILVITLEKYKLSLSQMLREAGFDLSRPFTSKRDVRNGKIIIIFKQVVPGS